FTEAGREDRSYDGDEGGASGEENRVDVTRVDRVPREQRVDGAGDCADFGGDPGVHVGALDVLGEGDRGVSEAEGRFGSGREGVLRLLDGGVELEAELVVDQMLEGGDLVGGDGLVAQAGEQLARLAGLEERELIPALDLLVEPERDGEHAAEGAAVFGA